MALKWIPILLLFLIIKLIVVIAMGILMAVMNVNYYGELAVCGAISGGCWLVVYLIVLSL